MSNVKQITGREVVQTVSRTVFGQETEEREHIEIRPFATTPAIVSVKLGRTINLGNYESARVDVGIEIPCYREEVMRIYPAAFNHVAEVIGAEVQKIQANCQQSERSIEEIL